MDALEKIANGAFLRGAESAALSLGQKARPWLHRAFSSWKPEALRAGATLGDKALRVGGYIADAGRDHLLGSPIDTLNKVKVLSKGNSLDIGGTAANLYRNHFLPPVSGTGLSRLSGYASRALAVGVPAYQMYNAATGPAAERGGNIGAAVANIAASPITSQFGALGQAALAKPVSELGRWVGNGFKHQPVAPKPQSHAEQPASRLPHPFGSVLG